MGASGSVGQRIVDGALARGHSLRCQTRSVDRLERFRDRATIVEAEPDDPAALKTLVSESDAVIFSVGAKSLGQTTVFSDATSALLQAMEDEGVRRLVAITGVGAGETRGHGGWLYDRVIFPIFTRNVYADKDRQEALIAASGIDWTIVRPAPFSASAPNEPIEVHAEVRKDTVLRRITRDEVARFVLDLAESRSHIGQRLFIGHP